MGDSEYRAQFDEAMDAKELAEANLKAYRRSVGEHFGVVILVLCVSVFMVVSMAESEKARLRGELLRAATELGATKTVAASMQAKAKELETANQKLQAKVQDLQNQLQTKFDNVTQQREASPGLAVSVICRHNLACADRYAQRLVEQLDRASTLKGADVEITPVLHVKGDEEDLD